MRASITVTGDDPDNRRTRLGRLLRYLLNPVYYWVDLRGPDGRPSYTKVAGAVSFVCGLVLLFRLWAHWFHESENGGPHSVAELGFILGFSSLVFAVPYGLRGLSAWFASRGGGTAEVLTMAAMREPETLKAHAEVAQRRQQGQDHGEEPA